MDDLDILDDYQAHSHGRAEVPCRGTPHTSLFSSLVERAIWMSARSRRIKRGPDDQMGTVEVP